MDHVIPRRIVATEPADRRAVAAAKSNLRNLRIELAMLSHRVGGRAELKDVDLDCLDVLVRHGAMSPSELARRTGIHAATMTGILGRLERDGWILRERPPEDRRAVRLVPVPDRVREIFGHYGGMNDALDEILARYSEDELATINDFLERATTAGRRATEDLEAD
jgi:DNA-binding MarR family transcriptional regulator